MHVAWSRVPGCCPNYRYRKSAIEALGPRSVKHYRNRMFNPRSGGPAHQRLGGKRKTHIGSPRWGLCVCVCRHVPRALLRPDEPDGGRRTFRCHWCSCQLWSLWREASGNLCSGNLYCDAVQCHSLLEYSSKRMCYGCCSNLSSQFLSRGVDETEMDATVDATETCFFGRLVETGGVPRYDLRGSSGRCSAAK